MITANEIDRVYSDLSEAVIRQHNAGEAEIEAKATLDARRLSALAEGKIAGKNADEREAAARQLLAPEYSALATAEVKSRLTRLQVELCRMAVERSRARLRLAELAYGTPDAEVLADAAEKDPEQELPF